MMAGVTSSIWTGWLTRGASVPLMKWCPTSQWTIEQTYWRVRQPEKPHSPSPVCIRVITCHHSASIPVGLAVHALRALN